MLLCSSCSYVTNTVRDYTLEEMALMHITLVFGCAYEVDPEVPPCYGSNRRSLIPKHRNIL